MISCCGREPTKVRFAIAFCSSPPRSNGIAEVMRWPSSPPILVGHHPAAAIAPCAFHELRRQP